MPVLARPRVRELIERGAARRVTTVSGPTGAGKTVACAQWAAHRRHTGAQVAWLTLNPGDRRPPQLRDHLLAVLDGTAISAPAGEFADAGAADWPDRLLAAADDLTEPVTVIFDDVQELAGSEAASVLDMLVRHGPPRLRLVLVGRHLADLQVARLRVDGELAEIGGPDLACTPEEAGQYFAMLGIDLPAADRDELLARTLGWITGLRLAALRAEPGLPAETLARISGDDVAVADYLHDEVLTSQPADRRMFLLRTSVADQICGSLADSLTGGTGGAALLDRLRRENIMVVLADESPDRADGVGPDDVEYRYQPLLRDLLRADLRRELPGEVPVLYRTAARWQAARGQHASAVRSAAQAGDWDFASQVLAEVGPALLLPDPAAAIEPALDTFPSGRCGSDAPLAGALASASMRAGDARSAAPHLTGAMLALPQSDPARRQIIEPWLRALEFLNASDPVAERTRECTLLASRAGDEARDAAGHQAVGLLWYALGVTTLGDLEVTEASEVLRRALRHFDAGGARGLHARAAGWLAIAETLSGDITDAETLAAQAGESSEDLTTVTANLARAHAGLAKDDVAAAHRHLNICPDGPDRPLPGATTAERRTVRVVTTLARARLALCEGEPSAARSALLRHRYLDQRRQQDHRPGSGPHPESERSRRLRADRALALLDAEVSLFDGDLDRARLALEQPAGGQNDGRPARLLLIARVLLADGDSQGTLAALAPLLDGCPGQMTLTEQVGALVTAAIAHRRLSQADQACERLSSAIALAEPHGLLRPFLDGGSAARSALTVLIRPASVGALFAAKILQRFEVARDRPHSQPATAAVPLTSSELAVLRFLPSHMTNQEIAESLFLSINTVKTHLRSVYRKLGVTTRRQAISRGGQTGLL